MPDIISGGCKISLELDINPTSTYDRNMVETNLVEAVCTSLRDMGILGPTIFIDTKENK